MNSEIRRDVCDSNVQPGGRMRSPRAATAPSTTCRGRTCVNSKLNLFRSRRENVKKLSIRRLSRAFSVASSNLRYSRVVVFLHIESIRIEQGIHQDRASPRAVSSIRGKRSRPGRSSAAPDWTCPSKAAGNKENGQQRHGGDHDASDDQIAGSLVDPRPYLNRRACRRPATRRAANRGPEVTRRSQGHRRHQC